MALEGVSDVTIHIEAARHPDPDAADIFASVKHAASELGLTVHEIWAHRYNDDLALEMHVGVDPQLSLGEAHELVDQLERIIQERLPEVRWVHTHIELATTQIQQFSEESLQVIKIKRAVKRCCFGDVAYLV